VDPKKFFAELQRRNVYKVAVAYGVVSWLLIQIATQVFPIFEIPNWAARLVVIALTLGFPVALVLAWVYELTPEGLQRTDAVNPKDSIAHRTGRKLDFVIIGVLLAVITVMAFQHYRPATPPMVAEVTQKSIVILPFLDFSQTKDKEYFSDGITEEIINSLAHVHGLFVVARTTAFSFKNKNPDIREVGRQLGVSHVLEGSVSHGPGKVRVVAQLINVATGYHLWSETYDSTDQDFLSLQSDVAKKVASALQIELHLAETTQLAKPLTQDPEAYDLYLRGRYLLNKRTVDSIQRALALFEQAIAKDPQFALGHAGLADAYIHLGLIGALTAEDAAARAWPEVSRALTIDDQLADGHVSRAILLADFEWNWPAAEVDVQKALALNSNSASAHHWSARHLAETGRFQEAQREVAAAQKLDPLSPMIRVTKAKIFFLARQYEQAIPPCQAALELEPNYATAFSILGQAHAHLGDRDRSIEAAQKYVDLSQGSGWAKLELAYAYAVAGNRTESDRIVQEVTTRKGEFSPYDMAAICSAWHDADGALRWLEKAIAQRSVDVISIRVDPRLDNVRSDARFQEVLARMVPRRNSP
jgi:TolB-like protein/Tfp pilus assembly protein PilF